MGFDAPPAFAVLPDLAAPADLAAPEVFAEPPAFAAPDFVVAAFLPAPAADTFFRSRFGLSAPDLTPPRLRGAGTVACPDTAVSSMRLGGLLRRRPGDRGGFGGRAVLDGLRRGNALRGGNGVSRGPRRQIQRLLHLHQQRMVPLKRSQLLPQLGDLGADPLLLLGVALEVVRDLGDVLRREIGGGDGRVVGHEGVLSSCGLPVASHGTAGRG